VSFTSPTRHAGFTPRKTWAGAAILTLGFLFGSSEVMAIAPPANAVIGNMASATYLDPNGNSHFTNSNQVETTVQQVGSFTLDGNSTVTINVINSKTGAAGATVYAPHVLTNTGNGPDTFALKIDAPAPGSGFTRVEVFADVNGDGLPDSTTPLCTAVPAASCNVTTPTVAGSNGVFQFVVAYSIPPTATSSTFSSPVSATITAAPTTLALYATTNRSAADIDHVSLTTGAAFNATKGLNAPAVAWSANGGVWPTVSSSGPRSASTCVADIAGATTPPPGCVYTVYTLSFNNTGAVAGMFAITDTLPTGFTYVPGSAVWSNAPGTALTDAALGDSTGIDFRSSGNTVTAVVTSLPANASQTISFVVMVNDTAAIGTSTTTNTAKYNPIDATGSTSTAPIGATSPTNPSSFTVTGTFGIVLGSTATGVTAALATDTSAGVPNATANDNTVLASAAAGSTVKFAQTVFNTGNASDLVNLSAAVGTFPAGTTFKFFAADGLTPLIDNNGDGIVDTGPIAAGQSTQIVMKATLPAMAVIPAGTFNAIVTATSTGDSTKTESTRDTITTIVGVLVDLTNSTGGNGVIGTTSNGDVGTGPSPDPTSTNTTAAGTTTVFPLFVKNNDTAGNTFSLAASQTTSFPGSLPAGWTVKFVAFPGTCADTAITSVAVSAAQQAQVQACVTPPTSQVAVTALKIYFQVRSTTATSTGAIAIDTKTDAVTVTLVATFSATLTPNNNGQVAPGGTVVYAHTLTNTGGQSCAGPYTVTATLPAADVAANWATALYIDNNGDGVIDGGDSLITAPISGPLLAGTTQKLLVKVFAPGGAVAGATDTATVTVTFPAGSCGTPSATDVTTVITGQMRVNKLQALDTACTGAVVPTLATPLTGKPGDCIVYRITATNEGAAPVTNMTINDAVPAYTSLTDISGQPATRCSSTTSPALTTAANYFATATTVSCGTATTVQPGGTATLTFSVKINN